MDADIVYLQPRNVFDPCIIGICIQTGRVIYSYEKYLLAYRNYMFADNLDVSDEQVEEYVRSNELEYHSADMTAPIFAYPQS